MLTEIKTNTLHYFVDEHNLRQGEYKHYYHNGQLSVHAFFQNDKLQGEYKHYYHNGQLSVHAFFQNDKLQGEYKDYHENGQLFVHTFYQNDKLQGEFIRYHKNGQLDYATFYYQGSDLNVNPDTLTKHDKIYIMMSGRLPQREQ